MSLALTWRNRASGNRASRFFWTHPEWWSVVLTAVAWGAVIPHAIAHQGHVYHMMAFQVEYRNWCLMSVAMMVPLMREPLRWVAFRSFRHRRHRAILLFLTGFLAPWLLVGILPAWLRTQPWVHNPRLATATLALAALWVPVTVRTRALVYCHRTAPLAPSGWKADRDCLSYGLPIGASCVVTCGFLMLACTFTGHNLIAMLGGAVLGALERRSFRPPTGRIFAGTLLLAGWFLLPISYATLPSHHCFSPASSRFTSSAMRARRVSGRLALSIQRM
jgi:hypothetical protein